MTGFTKGKFRVGMIGLTNEGQRPIMCNCDDGTVTRIAVVDLQVEAKRGQKWNAVDEERDANANLIAASPQLYEALAMADKVLAPFNGFAEINSWLAQVVEPALKAARGER